MRKLVVCLITMAVMLGFIFGTAYGEQKSFTIYLNTLTNETSATTCAPVSSVSAMVVEGGGGKYKRSDGLTVIDISKFNGGTGAIRLAGVTMSQATVVKGNTAWCNAGATFFLSATVAIGDCNILEVDRTPIYYGETAISGETITPRTFVIPKGDRLAFLFGAGSGTSLYSGVTFNVLMDIPESSTWAAPQPIHLKTLLFAMTSTTGTSNFTGNDSNGVAIPDGTRYLLAQNSTTSGVSVLYSQGGDTIVNATSLYIDAGDSKVFHGDLQTLKNINIKALGTTYLRVECWTAKPY